jgi:hypothetical protein
MMREQLLPLMKRWFSVIVLAGAVSLVVALSGASGSDPPANDNFANATPFSPLNGLHVSREGDTNVGATVETGEPPTIDGSTGGASVWYSWHPTTSGRVTIDTTTSDFDTLLAVYTGTTVSTLTGTEVASNDDYLGEPTSAVTFDFAAGTVYAIRVDGFAGDTGEINLHLNEVPANDDFANARPLIGRTATRSGDTNIGATLEPDEDDLVDDTSGGASVWYSWEPAKAGPVTIDTATSNFDTLLGVYTGTVLAELAEVASNDDFPPDLTSSVTFDADPSTTYWIKVDGFEGATGSINLHLVQTTVPGTPTGVSATAGIGQASVSWTPPASDGGSAIAHFEITPSVGGAAQVTTSVAAVTQATVTGLANGTSYTFKVAATNTIGTGAQSDASNAVTPQKAAQTISVTTHAPATASVGASFTVVATAPAGAVVFSSSGACSNSGATFTITSAGTCTVKYDQAGNDSYNAATQVLESVTVAPVTVAQRFALAIAKSGTGSGTVTSSVGGINCGTTCAANFDAGTSVTLSAVAGSNSTFVGWSGACSGAGPCTVTVDAAKTATATFNQILQPAAPPPPAARHASCRS